MNVVGAIVAAARLLPQMAERGTGTFVITGGMPTPVPDVVSLSLGKAGVRALTQMLDTKYAPSGLHVRDRDGRRCSGTEYSFRSRRHRRRVLAGASTAEWIVGS